MTPSTLRRRLVLLARLALCAALFLSMSPGAPRLLDELARMAHAGHDDAQTSGHDESGEDCASLGCDDCRDHGCTPDQHHCTCCVSALVGLPLVLPAAPEPVRPPRAADRQRMGWDARSGPDRATSPPVPPPLV